MNITSSTSQSDHVSSCPVDGGVVCTDRLTLSGNFDRLEKTATQVGSLEFDTRSSQGLCLVNKVSAGLLVVRSGSLLTYQGVAVNSAHMRPHRLVA